MSKGSPYKEGTIKLTWIKPNDYTVLESAMFKSVEAATEYAIENKKKDWLIFRLEWSDGGAYRWKLLPKGAYHSYTTGMKISDSLPIKIVGGALMVLGVVYIAQFLKNKGWTKSIG